MGHTQGPAGRVLAAVAPQRAGARRVELTWPEMTLAAIKGVVRHVSAVKAGRQAQYGVPPERAWQAHIEGALGECGVAKDRNRYWSAMVGEVRPGDVGRLEVRATTHLHGHLIVYPKDPDRAPFVLVVGVAPWLWVVGWLRGGAAKQTQWWRERDGEGLRVRWPAFFVPQEALEDVATLPGGW